ncbi:MAG: hypothetical protein GEV06_27350 [Luteitalea sp.]|nr:hypothetical protein [Luteitalea sp.]
MSMVVDATLMEMDQEAVATRRLLERVPEDKLNWKPHPKSFSLGQIALHVAQVQGAVCAIATQDVFQVPEFKQKEAETRTEILETFERSLSTVRDLLTRLDDQRLMGTWTLEDHGEVLMTVPRVGLLRSLMLNHFYHHRGQLVVYLRMLNVPIPSIYGPTADENPFARRTAATPSSHATA